MKDMSIYEGEKASSLHKRSGGWLLCLLLHIVCLVTLSTL